MSDRRDRIIYFGDPLCSWCYGFAPEISKAKTALEKEFQFQLVLGGLRPHGTEKMPQLKEMLRHHWDDVYRRSGQEFHYEILDDEAFVYDTEPPSRAVVVIRSLRPESEFEFFKDVQKLFYFDNKNTNNVISYLPLIKKYDVAEGVFKKEFESDKIKKRTEGDFQVSRNFGIQGFPSTVLQHREKYYMIAHGYAEASVLIQRIEDIVAKAKA